jgi:hypothetical protein
MDKVKESINSDIIRHRQNQLGSTTYVLPRDYFFFVCIVPKVVKSAVREGKFISVFN